MSEKPEIDIDVVGKLEILNEEVQRILNLVSRGLSSNRGEIEQSATGLPGIPFRLHPAWYEHQEPKELEDEFDRWLVACGFRDLIESCGRFLEDIRSVLSALQLVATGNESDVGEWFEREKRQRKKFHTFGLPKKMETLCTELGIERLSPLQPQLLSINRVRNCLVHRNGLVSETDTADGPLRMEWLAVRLDQYHPNGNIQLRSDEEMPGGGVIIVCTNQRRKEFAGGEMVTISSREFNEACFTVYAFGKMVVELSFKYADKLGIEGDEEINRQWRRRCPIGLSLQRPRVSTPDRNTLVAVEWKEGSLRIG